MTEVTGVFARIRMSEQAKERFFKDKAAGLLADHFCIIKARETQRQHDAELGERRSSEKELSVKEYMQFLAKSRQSAKLLCDVGDKIIIRYDQETESLFYMQMFSHGGIANINTSLSLKTFLASVAEYKDVDAIDFVFFSGGATNLKTSSFYRIWEIRRSAPLKLVEWEEKLMQEIDGIDALSRKYYFDVVDQFVTHEKGVTYIDDEQFETELKPIDPNLMKHK